jgi:hypothetical protein
VAYLSKNVLATPTHKRKQSDGYIGWEEFCYGNR